MMNENIDEPEGTLLEFQYPPDGQIFTKEIIKYNNQVKNNIYKILQEQGALQLKIILSKHGKRINHGEAFILSFFMNPFQQFKFQLDKMRGQQAKFTSVSPNFQTFWQIISKMFNPNDEAVKRLMKEFVDERTDNQVREKIFLYPISHLPYALRRFNQFVGVQELNLVQQLIMSTHFVLISSYNKLFIRYYKPQKLFERLQINFYENFMQLELFFLQRLNYHILYSYPEDFVDQYLNLIQQKFNKQPSEQLYKLLFKTASTSRVVLFVQPDVICQFCLLEALLIENSDLGPRQVLYNKTSRYKELDQCRKLYFDYGQADVGNIYDRLLPLNGNGLNLDQCLSYLQDLFSDIIVEYK